MAQRKRKVRGVDYNTEIPFQKTAPAGFHDTVGEDEQAEAAVRQDDGAFKSILKSKLEAPRKDLMEAKARKADAEKQKRRKQEDLPAAVAALNKQKDLMAIQKRQKLMLPPPQVTDRELSEVVKASASGFADDGAVDATRMLTNSYESTPSQEAMRTPRTAAGASGGDLVLEEAAAHAAMLARDTPLKGGESASFEPASLGEFSGITPRGAGGALATPTPNPNATPSGGGRGPGATPGGTPARGGGGATPSSTGGGATPGRSSVAGSVAGSVASRDAFGINLDEGGDLMGLHPSQQRRQQKARSAALAGQLASLPAPAHEYSIVMPEMPDEADGMEGEEGEAREEDALDRDEREGAEAAAALAAEVATRSSALQRELPRPLVVNRELLAPRGDEVVQLAAAEKLLRDEVVKMLESDASHFPVPGAPEPTNKKKPYKLLDAALLGQAKDLIAAEAAAIAEAQPLPSADEMRKAWGEVQAELIYVPSKQRCAPSTHLLRSPCPGSLTALYSPPTALYSPLTAPHSPSQPLTAPHGTSQHLTAPHSTSQHLTAPSRLRPPPHPPSRTLTHPHAPLRRYAPSSTVGKAERLQAYQQQLQLVKNFVTRDHKKAQKVEKKLDLTLGGYRKRAATLRTEIVDKQQACREKRLELSCFEMLQQQEALAQPQRLAQMGTLVSEQSVREVELQASYAELLRKRDSLLEQLHP